MMRDISDDVLSGEAAVKYHTRYGEIMELYSMLNKTDNAFLEAMNALDSEMVRTIVLEEAKRGNLGPYKIVNYKDAVYRSVGIEGLQNSKLDRHAIIGAFESSIGGSILSAILVFLVGLMTFLVSFWGTRALLTRKINKTYNEFKSVLDDMSDEATISMSKFSDGDIAKLLPPHIIRKDGYVIIGSVTKCQEVLAVLQPFSEQLWSRLTIDLSAYQDTSNNNPTIRMFTSAFNKSVDALKLLYGYMGNTDIKSSNALNLDDIVQIGGESYDLMKEFLEALVESNPDRKRLADLKARDADITVSEFKAMFGRYVFDDRQYSEEKTAQVLLEAQKSFEESEKLYQRGSQYKGKTLGEVVDDVIKNSRLNQSEVSEEEHTKIKRYVAAIFRAYATLHHSIRYIGGCAGLLATYHQATMKCMTPNAGSTGSKE